MPGTHVLRGVSHVGELGITGMSVLIVYPHDALEKRNQNRKTNKQGAGSGHVPC